MAESCQASEGIDFSGVFLPIRVRAGDSFKIDTEISVPSGITASSPAMKVYDADGVEQTGITETASLSGSILSWGILDEAESSTLDPDTDYTYVLRIELSNGVIQSLYYGPLRVTPASGRGVSP